MSDLITRYVHQVGRYLPPAERAEIQAELRSQIQDQLDDRYAGAASQGEVAEVLAELGDPWRLAISYNRDQYLVGPDLYPFMIGILRYGWLIVPAVVIFLHLFAVLISPPQHYVNLIVEAGIDAVAATAVFSGAVVLIFAVIQRVGAKRPVTEIPFNPFALPKVDDPGVVDRFETTLGIALGIIVSLAIIYYLNVGGLTLQFGTSDPGAVIAVPLFWLFLLLVSNLTSLVLHLLVLARNRWGVGAWLLQTLLEVFGMICLYFVLYLPVFERLAAANPDILNTPVIASMPQILVVITAVGTLVSRGGTLVRLWNYRTSDQPVITRTDG